MAETIIKFGDLLKLARSLKKSPDIDKHSRIQTLIGFVGCARKANERYRREAIDQRIASEECPMIPIEEASQYA